ncbi:hypothetical protein ACSBR2_020205 [Camellia fascicularis]
MAGAILIVSISTVTAETAFSAVEQVLSDYDNRLSLEMVEALTILRAHMHALTRRQDCSENEIIQGNFNDISLGTVDELSNSFDD